MARANTPSIRVASSRAARTPDSVIPKQTGLAGRGHWGPVQTVLFAGGGITPAIVVGASDKQGAFPVADRQTPESFTATIYPVLGIPKNALWHDVENHPHHVYHVEPSLKLI